MQDPQGSSSRRIDGLLAEHVIDLSCDKVPPLCDRSRCRRRAAG
jgi:hypothetical protein